LPTAAQKKRLHDTREYFREKLLTVVNDVEEAWPTLQTRFGINRSQWSPLKRQLGEILAAARKHNGKVVASDPEDTPPLFSEPEEIVIPADMPVAAKSAFNVLLARNGQLANEVRARDVEIAAMRGVIASNTKRINTLRGALKDVIDAI